MTHPLASCVVKLNRAELHAESFRTQLGEQKTTVTSTVKYHAPPGSTPPPYLRWLVSTDMVIAPEVSAPLGDAIHNLRSALDHLVWGLTIERGGRVGKSTHFPIRSDKAGMTNTNVKKTLRELGDSQRTIIDNLQPYKRRDPTRHPLAMLARLDDDDKHQALYVFDALPRNVMFDVLALNDCEVIEVLPNIGVSLQAQAEIGRIHVRGTGPYPEVKMEANFVPDVKFSDGTAVLDRFEQLRRFVFEQVLPPLAPELRLTYPAADLPGSHRRPRPGETTNTTWGWQAPEEPECT